MDWLHSFVVESNRIEGIFREPHQAEIDAHTAFLSIENPSVADVESFVAVIAPNHILRRAKGLNVRVGDYVAPDGGLGISLALEELLKEANSFHAQKFHVIYEMLHPFTDGNGRSGRLLWLWHLSKFDHREFNRAQRIGFLHSFYYQTLAAQQGNLLNSTNPTIPTILPKR